MAAATLIPTPGEALVVWRRREKLTQVEAAERFRVHPDRYREWEADRRADIPRRALGPLQPHEVYFLMRRRSGKTQREIAAALGMTRLWVIKMEEGVAPTDRLRDYWGV